MSNIVHLATRQALDLGTQQEIAMRLITMTEALSGGHRPVTDIRGDYHALDPDSNLWVAEDDNDLECRVDAMDGCDVVTAKGVRPLKLKASDSPAVVKVMKRNTLRPYFFRDDLIAFENGAVARVVLDEIDVEALRPDHGARLMLPVEYSAQWILPKEGLLYHYLSTTFEDEDDRLFAVELLGAALMGLGTRLKKAVFFTDGEDIDARGGTGKSQLLAMLQGLVPDERICHIPPQKFVDYDGADLMGKTLNLVYEAPDTDLLREEGIKAIVHGEKIRARMIRERPIEFEPLALHVFAVQRPPAAPGASGAFWDRWTLLEFNKRFRDTDEAIPDIGRRVVDEELTDLVHLALEGARRLLSRGAYTVSEGTREGMRRWRRDAEPVAVFFDEMCVHVDSSSPATWTQSKRLYELYQDWCKDNGHSPCSHQKFGRRIPATIEKSRSGGRSVYRVEIK